MNYLILFIEKFFCKLILFIRFVSCTHPWFGRGYDVYLGTESGVFAFGNDLGHTLPWGSFRGYLL